MELSLIETAQQKQIRKLKTTLAWLAIAGVAVLAVVLLVIWIGDAFS